MKHDIMGNDNYYSNLKINTDDLPYTHDPPKISGVAVATPEPPRVRHC